MLRFVDYLEFFRRCCFSSDTQNPKHQLSKSQHSNKQQNPFNRKLADCARWDLSTTFSSSFGVNDPLKWKIWIFLFSSGITSVCCRLCHVNSTRALSFVHSDGNVCFGLIHIQLFVRPVATVSREQQLFWFSWSAMKIFALNRDEQTSTDASMHSREQVTLSLVMVSASAVTTCKITKQKEPWPSRKHIRSTVSLVHAQMYETKAKKKKTSICLSRFSLASITSDTKWPCFHEVFSSWCGDFLCFLSFLYGPFFFAVSAI